MNMRKIVAMVVMLTVALCAAAATLTADAIMKNAAAKLNAAKSVTAQFVLTSGGHTAEGTMLIAADRYRLTSNELRVWYDGLTQWTWMKRSDEVNITEPTADEILESNPFAILNHYATHYKCRRLTSPKGTYAVELIPLNRSESAIDKANVTINASTGWPERIQLWLDDKSTVDIAVKSITTGAKPDAKAFVYDSKTFKAKAVIDLR